MPNLLAMSFEGRLAPSFDLHCLKEGRPLPDGWGLGYYPGGDPSVTVLKEPAPPPESIRGELAKAWEHLESSLFLLHIRKARWGAISDANTQPFSRSFARRDWLIGHCGTLTERAVEVAGPFEPVGATDTEQAFCSLLNRLVEHGWKTIDAFDLAVFRDDVIEISSGGDLSFVLSDGSSLLAFTHPSAPTPLQLLRLKPPYAKAVFGDGDVSVDLSARGTMARKGVIVTSGDMQSAPDAAELEIELLPPGKLVVIRQGVVVAGLDPDGRTTATQKSRRSLRPAERTTPKTYRVIHRTSYEYQKAVEQSVHLFRMTPVYDRLQRVLDHQFRISVSGKMKDFEDVFGNRVRRLWLDSAWKKMSIEVESLVEVRDLNPLDYRPLYARSTIPLVWMPWQREAMQPFLLPPELPETQLQELTEYAMSFVERNDYDLLETLLDINHSIFGEYAYTQGSTTLDTTPFDVYVSRRGVCQDFTNLFICLARLLGVPARYVCGYVYTGPKHTNQAQSEASHAWVQLYLPEVGWKGFDPTNGVLTQTEHIRVAVGRNYRDATPTSGTIYLGGGTETLTVDVSVEPTEPI